MDAKTTDAVAAAARDLADARRLLVVTGAGVSTESGIPDFRSPGGLWTRFDPDEFRYDKFLADPARFWRLRAALMEEMDLSKIRPNAAHRAIAQAESSGKLLGVVTQNIDGLHLEAGTSPGRLVQIHGTATRVRCVDCDRWFPFEEARAAVDAGNLPPPCPECGGVLKPGTVLFGEMLPQGALERAHEWAETCDAILVVGSSLGVWPAAGVVPAAVGRGARLFIVNREPTPFDGDAHHVIRASAGEAVPALLAEAGFVP